MGNQGPGTSGSFWRKYPLPLRSGLKPGALLKKTWEIFLHPGIPKARFEKGGKFNGNHLPLNPRKYWPNISGKS